MLFVPGYTLVITEKPDAANRIAAALDMQGNPKRNLSNGVPYYEVYSDGWIVIVPALGHLYTLMSKNKRRDYPVFDYQWVPRYQAERKAARFKTWLKVIADLAEGAEGFVDACDFDVEGSIIGYSILRYACGNKHTTARRMKYSTLTSEELQESYSHLLPTLDFALVEAGLTRHEVDWLYGINLSRALTTAAKKCLGQYATLSTGRVQGPALKFLVERSTTINSFVPTPYWTLTAKADINGKLIELEYEKTIETQTEAMQLRDACKAKGGKVEKVEVSQFEQPPPFPFDLGGLQSEAYSIFKYTPTRTSNILQHLYLAALISYPRTSSQKLPPSIGYKIILKKLSKAPAYNKPSAELLSKPTLKPNEGKKFDPAHPAIYPTGNLPEKPLDAASRNIFDLVVKRFFAVFGEPAIRQRLNATLSIDGNLFRFSAVRTLLSGWTTFYEPYVRLQESALPPLMEGQIVQVKSVNMHSLFTRPPPHYNPRTLLEKMEQEEIGTKATRAAIMQTLLDRKYVAGSDRFVVTDLGFKTIEVLTKYCPTIVSPELTRKLEQEMDAIQAGNQTKETVLQNAKETLRQVTSELKDNEAAIGAELSEALQTARLEERTVGTCPTCQNGKLVVLRSKKSGKRFVGCSNYFAGKCSTAYPLPQTGVIKPLSVACKTCGSPIVAVLGRGRRTWRLCLNPNCPSKGEKKS